MLFRRTVFPFDDMVRTWLYTSQTVLQSGIYIILINRKRIDIMRARAESVRRRVHPK